MARPRKDGLDYFPVDVNILSDIKTKKLIRSYGTKTVAILIYLLSAIYRDNGYYLEYDDDLKFIITDEFDYEETFVENVILKMVEVDFFNNEMFQKYKILTSEGIQKRFFKASERRVSVNILQTYCLINDSSTGFMYTKTPDKPNKCEQKPRSSGVSANKGTQSKEKNSTEKESKKQESKNKVNNKVNSKEDTSSGSNDSDVQELITMYQDNFGVCNSLVINDIQNSLMMFDKDVIIESFRLSIGKDNPYLYMKGIWNKWKDEGITTLEQVRASKERHEKNKPTNYKKSGYVEPLPDWAK